MSNKSLFLTTRPTLSICTLLAALVGAGCGMRTAMETADDDGDGMGGGGADAGGSKAGGGASGSGLGSKPSSSRAGSAAAGNKSSQAGASGAAASSPGGSPTGGISAAAGSAGSRAGAGSIAAGSSGSSSTSSAGSKAGASGSSVTGGSKSSSSSSGKRDAGTPDTRLPPDANPTVPPKINTNSGYATVPAGTVVMSGYVSSYVGGSGSSISLDYTETSFCASGKVGASSTYNSWAGAGFNVNQAQSGSSGSIGSLKIEGSTISISYENKKDSRLELQLWDGSNYWCTYLPSAKGPNTYTVPLSNLNTKCWDGTGTPFKSGTSITTVQLVTPGSATSATPFDYCFLGITIQ